MLGSRFASMLFPEPGGPIIRMIAPIKKGLNGSLAAK